MAVSALRPAFAAATRVTGSPAVLRRLALASLVANIVIVGTGGAVRLTGSGLGCPTWPRCDGTSYVTTPEVGYHGVIEFTNRTLTGVVGVLAALCVLVAWAQRGPAVPKATGAWDVLLARGTSERRRLGWAVAVLASIPAQAVLGGITVLTKLNPWAVASHFLLSMLVIAAADQLNRRSRPAAPPAFADLASVTPELRYADSTISGPGAVGVLGALVLGVTAAALVAGTVVTGSGPHAGDAQAKRTGLDPGMVAQLHTDLVMLLIGLSVAAWLALIATGAPARARRAALVLIAIECSQALIGFVQYFTHLPVLLVGLHMLGACLVWVGALGLYAAIRPPRAAASPAPGDAVPEASVIRTPEMV